MAQCFYAHMKPCLHLTVPPPPSVQPLLDTHATNILSKTKGVSRRCAKGLWSFTLSVRGDDIITIQAFFFCLSLFRHGSRYRLKKTRLHHSCSLHWRRRSETSLCSSERSGGVITGGVGPLVPSLSPPQAAQQTAQIKELTASSSSHLTASVKSVKLCV